MKIKRNPAAQQVADLIIANYKPTSIKDVQEALKEAFAPIFENMLQAEMTAHLGYEKSNQDPKEDNNRRNGYTTKTITTSGGKTSIKIPRDRDGSFAPVIVPKHCRDLSEIENKVLAMYARGMSQRDIAKTIEDIYGFTLSHDKISTITDLILEDVKQWQNRSLEPVYVFMYVDCLYVSVRNEYKQSTKQAVYTILGIDPGGKRDILGFWISPNESKAEWMNIFDQLKQRGVQDILFLSMDGVSGLEEGLKAIFPDTTVQRCIVHLLRNSLQYIPKKDYSAYCKDIKAVYGAASLEECQERFKEFCSKWQDKYPGAVRVWQRHIEHVEQLFNYPKEVRRMMYTTNAIESVNSSLRKVTKKGSFDSPNAVFKLFYLRLIELQCHWTKQTLNWANTLNQLTQYDDLRERIGRWYEI